MRIYLFLSLMIALCSCTTLHAEPTERDAILRVMDDVFAAVKSSEAADWRALQLAEGTTLSFRPDACGTPDKFEMRVSNNDDFIADLKPDGHDYVERWVNEPTVLIRGPIAMVWGEYAFWIDGVFSHCGVDLVDMAKVEGRWTVVNFTWTVEKEGCASAQ